MPTELEWQEISGMKRLPEQGITEIGWRSVPRGGEQVRSAGCEQWRRQYQEIPSIINGNCKRINTEVAGKGSNTIKKSAASKAGQNITPPRLGGEQRHKC